MTEEQKSGVEAIQYLQSMANINESDEDALKGWNSMSKSEQKHTIRMYVHMTEHVEVEVQ